MQGNTGLNLAHYNNPNLRGMTGMAQWRAPSSQDWPFRMPGQQGSIPQLSQQLGSLPQMSQQLGSLPQMSQQQLGNLPQMSQQMALPNLAMQQQMAQMQVRIPPGTTTAKSEGGKGDEEGVGRGVSPPRLYQEHSTLG